MSCNSKNQSEHQEWPTTGLLYTNFNLPLKKLRSGLSKIPTEIEDAIVYSYVIRSIEKDNEGSFMQTGSGPNFEGDVITLCTCKHKMRTYGDTNFWRNKWIAGFSGVEAGEGKNVLVYLMPVSQAFESYSDLWTSKILTAKAKKQKNSRGNKLGDLYEPRRLSLKGEQRFTPKNYQDPDPEHSHSGRKWHKDVNYYGCSNRRPVLLVGDRNHSFLWSKPTIFCNGKMTQGANKKKLSEFLGALERV